MTKQKKATSDDVIRAVANSVLGREKRKRKMPLDRKFMSRNLFISHSLLLNSFGHFASLRKFDLSRF